MITTFIKLLNFLKSNNLQKGIEFYFKFTLFKCTKEIFTCSLNNFFLLMISVGFGKLRDKKTKIFFDVRQNFVISNVTKNIPYKKI